MVRISVIFVILLLLIQLNEGGFPLIFPFLTTGWYYKPSPGESVVLGLMLVKVLALRLAGATGLLPIPYHLNDLFTSSISSRILGKRSVRKDSDKSNQSRGISIEEFRVIERILLSLRRIDSNDCFIKVVCQMSQDELNNKMNPNPMLKVFRLRETMNKTNHTPSSSNKEWSVWNVYEEATTPKKLNCTEKYPLCPLSNEELQFEKLLISVF